MMKNPIIGYAITEQVSEPVNENSLEECEVGGLKYLRFPSVLQEFDVFNRNRRNYGGKAMNEGLRAENVQELLANGDFFGEAGHPITKDMTRIMTVDLKNVSHRIKSLDIKPDHVSGIIETIPDGTGVGNKMYTMMMTGTMPSFSLRAIAPLIKRPDGTTLIRQAPRIVTYDWVVFPSHKCARYKAIDGMQHVTKNTNLGTPVKESTFPIYESQVLDFLKDESKNLKLISSVYETGLGNMRLTTDGKFVIVKENGGQYAVAIEEKIRREVNGFMSNF